jgi:DNA-damage-inducible protein J
MNTTLQLRIDKKTKTHAQKIFKELGVDMSSGVKMFLQQVVNTESIPFEIRTPNGFTLAKEEQIQKETAWAQKHGKRYASAKQMLKSIVK